MNNGLKITGSANSMFRLQNTLKKTGIKLYNTPALAALLYSGEKWAINARDAIRITAAEMKYKQQDILGQIIKQIQTLQRN
jgi:hypothetical protein